MNNSATNEFKELAKIYIKAFQKSFSQVDTSEVGSSTISFAEVRVVSFILNNFSSPNVSSLRWVMTEAQNNMALYGLSPSLRPMIPSIIAWFCWMVDNYFSSENEYWKDQTFPRSRLKWRWFTMFKERPIKVTLNFNDIISIFTIKESMFCFILKR